MYEDCKAAKSDPHHSGRETDGGNRGTGTFKPGRTAEDANRYHSLTAIQVQEIAQSLYEKKLISYPRTSSRLLPKDVYDTLPPVMEKMLSRKEFRQYASTVDLAAPRDSIEAQDTMEHHAIIITGTQPGKLDREEMLVYTLIVGRVLETFMPPCKVEYTTVDTVCAARKFRIRTYRILEKGWLGIFEREHLVAKGCMPYLVMPDRFSGRDAAGGRMQPYT